MAYVFPSGVPLKTGPDGKLLGGTYYPPGQEPKPAEVEGDPEKAKAILNALGWSQGAQMIDMAQQGQNPLASNVTIIEPNTVLPGEGTATTGDTGSASEGPLRTVRAVQKEVVGQITNILGGANPGALPFDNPLENFASMNCIFGFGCLSPYEVNFPDKTYRKDGIKAGQVALKSGQTPQGKPRIYAEKAYGIDTGYYIDDVQIDTTIAPNPRSRSTNFHNLTFKVTEPLSMGLFLQTLQKCAKNAGYSNYLEAVWLLTLDFKGYNDEGQLVSPSIGAVRKLFPVSLVSIDFDVNEQGSTYNVTCSVANDTAFTDQVQGLPVDITVSGRNLKEICQTGLNSICTNINTHLLQQKQEASVKHEIDEYIIAFPTELASAYADYNLAGLTENATATTGDLQFREFDDDAVNFAFESADSTSSLAGYQEFYEQQANSMDPNLTSIDIKREYIEDRLGFSVKRGRLSEGIKKLLAGNDVLANAIGRATIDPGDPLGAGNSPFGLASFAWNRESGLLERGGTKIDPKLRTIQFRRGTLIQKIIEDLVMISDYGKGIARQLNTSTDGMVDWFRVESQVFLVNDPEAEKVIGRMPRIYVYRVVPYKVHKSIFQMPNDPPPGYDRLMAEACKRYDYIYTGFNKNVLGFEIKFDNAFYTSIQPDVGNRAGNNDPAEQGNTNRPVERELQGNPNTPQGDGRTVQRRPSDLPSETAGAVTEDPDLRLARQFNEAVVNSDADLITIDMEILGDPYFIADSGVGNYNSEGTNYYNLTSDGSISYQTSEVDIIINFRTPVDIDPETGTYLLNGASIGLSDFSGLYKVNEVSNTFSGNVFKQTLSCVRRRNFQTADPGSAIQEQMLAEKERHDRRVQEARENGTVGDVEFAIADTNGDGVLQYWEVPDPERAQALAQGRGTGAQYSERSLTGQTGGTGATASGDAGDGLRGGGSQGASDIDTTGASGTTADGNNTEVSTTDGATTLSETVQGVTDAVGSAVGNLRDLYYRYGGGRD